MCFAGVVALGFILRVAVARGGEGGGRARGKGRGIQRNSDSDARVGGWDP